MKLQLTTRAFFFPSRISLSEGSLAKKDRDMFSATGTPTSNQTLVQRSVPGSSTSNERAGLLTSPSLQQKSSLINTTPDPVGVKFNSLDDAAASVKGLRTWNIVLTIFVAIAFTAAFVAGAWAWGLDRPPNIQPDSLTNEYESRVVEFGVLFDNTGDYTICSGGHIGSSGQVRSRSKVHVFFLIMSFFFQGVECRSLRVRAWPV